MNEIFSAVFRLYTRYFGVILGLVLTIALPCQLLLSHLKYSVIGKENIITLWQASLILEAVFGVVITGGILHSLFVDRMQRRAGFPECLSTAVSQWGRLAWTNFLVLTAIFLGTLLFILPGIFLAIRLSMALTVTITEGEWGLKALSRSMKLTADHSWQVVGVGMFVYLMVVIAQLVIAMIMTLPTLDHWLILAGLGTLVHLVGGLVPISFFVLYEKLAEKDVIDL